MSQVHSYLRILTGYGKTKSIGLSFLKSHPPAICWRSCNTMPRHYKKGATHEQHPKSPQIYIYILTHANAGWAYDRQSREVWKRRKRSKTGGRKCHYHCRRTYSLLYGKRNVEKRSKSEPSSRRREHADTDFEIGNYNGACLNGSNRENENRYQRLSCHFHAGERRLTSKEVAA